MKDRSYYQRANAKLNPDTDYLQIFQNLTFHDFPWDMAGPNLGAGCPFPHRMTGAQDGHKGAEA